MPDMSIPDVFMEQLQPPITPHKSTERAGIHENEETEEDMYRILKKLTQEATLRMQPA